MAVAEQTPYKEYIANGVTNSFPLEFDCDDQDHLIVTVNDIEIENGYWLLINGAVVFGSAPADQSKIIIQRNTPLERNTNYQTTNNSFRPQSVNKDFDRIWWKLQELWVQVTLLWAALNSKIAALWLALNQEIQDRVKSDLDIRAWVQVLLNNIVDNGLISAIAVTTVESVADLQYLVSWDGRTVYVKSYYQGLGKGGGTRIYSYVRRNENDGFLCINGWVLQVVNNTVTCSQAGAKNDPSFDSTSAVQKALLFSGKTQIDDYYYTRKPVWFPVSKVIEGIGKWSCGIVKNGDDGVLNLVHDKTTGKTTLDKNAVLIGYADRPNTTYCEELSLSNFSLRYAGLLQDSIGLYIPTICRSMFLNLLIEDAKTGIRTTDSWDCSWFNVHVRNSETAYKYGASDGTLTVNGTSNNMIGCYAEVVSLNAYWFKNYQYSTMSGCAADKVSHMQDGGSSIYVFDNTDMVINNAGCEHITTRHSIIKNSSNIIFNLGNFILDNSFQDGTTWWQQSNTLLSISNESKVLFKQSKFSIENQLRNGNSKFAAFASIDGGCKLTLDDISSYKSQIVNFVENSEYETYNSLDIYYVSGSVVEVKTPLDLYEYKASGGNSNWFNATATNKRLEDTFKAHSSNAFSIPIDMSLTQLANTYQTVVASQTVPSAATSALEYPFATTAHIIQQWSAKRQSGDNLTAQLAIPIWTANSIGQGALRIRFKQGNSSFSDFRTIFTDNDSLIPRSTASQNLGSSSLTWNNIYSQNAVTVVSDERYKTDISELDEQEIQCAIACGKLYRKYKLNAAVNEKGLNAARYHIGAIAQDIVQCFVSHGLDWRKYGVVTYEKWEADEQLTGGEIFMLRYEELNCFVNAGLQHRLSQLES